MTSVVTAQELAAMRDIANSFFPDTCTVQTLTTGVDETGSPTQTWANTYTNVACRLDPATGSETVRNLALEGESTWWLNIPYDQAIAIENRVVYSSKTYEIRHVVDTQSYSTIRRAMLVRVNDG